MYAVVVDPPQVKEEIAVSAIGPEGQTTQTSFTVTVTRPVPARTLAKEIAVDLGNGVKLEMILIPAGAFFMGSPNSESGRDPNEGPQHKVWITKPFYLGKYLVAQELWQAVMGNNPSRFKGPTNPVEEVSWNDCQEFLKKLNERTRRPRPSPRPEGEGEFRLPTEAQWEYACRAGSATRYCFEEGDPSDNPFCPSLDDFAWYDTNSGNTTHPVGEKKPNAWGLYDMHGNVWEWCQDWYGIYSDGRAVDPTGPAGGSFRMYRGGGWSSAASGCRLAQRDMHMPGYRDSRLGLRVLVPAEAATEMPLAKSAPPLKIHTISPQTVEAGKPLSIAVSVEDAQQWKGKVRYSLAPNAPPGAGLDPTTGEFSWTPPLHNAQDRYDLTVSAKGPDGQMAQTTFVVTVTQPPPPLEKEIAVDLGGGVKLEMVLIPAGEFLMGSRDSDEDAGDDEKPQHRVRIIKPFCLGKYLVTQEQWKTVMGSNPSHFKGPQNPVETVSWDDCQQFFDKLNAKSGSGRGKFQLPTEAQWEYACRAGSTTEYCFGDDEARLGKHAWYGNDLQGTHPVGKKKPNAWGLYDMHGNVCEWCQDLYGESYYAKSPMDDPTGPSGGSVCVFRGGNYYYPAKYCRSAFRSGDKPWSRHRSRGLRVSQVLAE